MEVKVKPRPTIQMIAEKSGVSRGTVDRVLNNRPNVRPDKLRRVLKVIKELDYRHQPITRIIAAAGHRYRLGVLIPDWTGHFEAEILRGVRAAEELLRLSGGEVLVERCSSQLPGEFIDKIDSLLARDVGGLAVCAVNSPAIRDKLREVTVSGVPVVTLNSDVSDSGRACFVGNNPMNEGRTAAGLLAKMLEFGDGVWIATDNGEIGPDRERVAGFMQRWTELGHSGKSCLTTQTFNSYDITYEKTLAAFRANPGIRGIYMPGECVPACVEALGILGLPRRIRIVAHNLTEDNRKLLLYCAVDFVIAEDVFYLGYRPLELLARMLSGAPAPKEGFECAGIHLLTAENLG